RALKIPPLFRVEVVIGGGFIEELPEGVLLSRVFTIGSTAAIRADLCSDGGAARRVGDCHLVAVAQGLAATGFGLAVDRHRPFGEDVLGRPSGLHEVGEFQELPQPDLGVTDGYDRLFLLHAAHPTVSGWTSCFCFS